MQAELKPFLKTPFKEEPWRIPDGVFNEVSLIIKEDRKYEIPEKSGAYIFTSAGQRFVYPEGNSPVIYIGKADNLRARLVQHSKIIKKVSNHTKLDDWWYNRYQYFRKFGCKAFWYTTRGTQKAKNLEASLLESFYNKYCSLPIGNSSFSFDDRFL